MTIFHHYCMVLPISSLLDLYGVQSLFRLNPLHRNTLFNCASIAIVIGSCVRILFQIGSLNPSQVVQFVQRQLIITDDLSKICRNLIDTAYFAVSTCAEQCALC